MSESSWVVDRFGWAGAAATSVAQAAKSVRLASKLGRVSLRRPRVRSVSGRWAANRAWVEGARPRAGMA